MLKLLCIVVFGCGYYQLDLRNGSATIKVPSKDVFYLSFKIIIRSVLLISSSNDKMTGNWKLEHRNYHWNQIEQWNFGTFWNTGNNFGTLEYSSVPVSRNLIGQISLKFR